MKTNTILNQSLFRQFGGSTKRISSSITICHPLSEGTYQGTVFHNKAPVGNFAVRCLDKEEKAQADVDMSAFVNIKADGSCDCKSNDRIYSIRPNGYVVFFSSQGESGFHVELQREEKEAKNKGYSTKALKKGDIVISMVLRPGVYEVTGNKSKMKLTVDVPLDYKDYQRFLETPALVSLNESSFSKSELNIMPGQGLVIQLETNVNVEVKLLKPTEVKAEPKRGKLKHGWVRPITPKYKKRGKKG